MTWAFFGHNCTAALLQEVGLKAAALFFKEHPQKRRISPQLPPASHGNAPRAAYKQISQIGAFKNPSVPPPPVLHPRADTRVGISRKKKSAQEEPPVLRTKRSVSVQYSPFSSTTPQNRQVRAESHICGGDGEKAPPRLARRQFNLQGKAPIHLVSALIYRLEGE